MELSKISILAVCVIFLWLRCLVRAEEEIKEENTVEEGDERTLGHLIRGGHALADTFVKGFLDGTHNLGNHMGQLISPVIGFQPLIQPPLVPVYPNPHGYGYGYSYGYGGGNLLGSPIPGQFPGGFHRPGFDGTYASRPFSAADRDDIPGYKPVHEYLGVDKAGFQMDR